MKNQEQLTHEHIEVFTFLNELRDSGETNMFGAAPYIQNEFATDKADARMWLSLWMGNYNEQGYSTNQLLK